eukprot:m.230407 g.230407  ORF g.230407 m.230407 type:complete len:545 (-) comp18000_c0_seq1:26-1660(-)
MALLGVRRLLYGRTIRGFSSGKPTTLDGTLDLTSEAVRTAHAAAKELQETVKRVNDTFLLGGGAAAIANHTQRNGKLLARDRVKKLLDPDTQFFEFGSLAGYQVYGDDVPAAGSVAGIGSIEGVQCMVLANDATVKGGTMYPLGVRKQLRAQAMAMRHALPVVYLVDSGGAFLPLQSELFADAQHGGRVFYNQAHMSAMGIPQFSIVCGSCTAGAAYVPAMTDQAVIVRGIGTIFLAGPPLVRAATGEVVSAEDLGGAAVHCYQSGLTDYFAPNELDAITTTRELVKASNHSSRKEALWTTAAARAPRYDPRELEYAVAPAAAAGQAYQGVPMRAIIARIADDSNLVEYKHGYGTSIVTGFASIGGHPIGLVANARPLLCRDGARKAANFVSLCAQRNLPTVFLVDVCGFDAPVDDPVMLKSAALLLRAVSCTQTPTITLTVGRAIGPASFAMCGRASQPAFAAMWPSATTCIATPDDLTQRGEDPAAISAMEKHAGALYAAARMWTDYVIAPAASRDHLIACLDVAQHSRLRGDLANFGVFRL